MTPSDKQGMMLMKSPERPDRYCLDISSEWESDRISRRMLRMGQAVRTLRGRPTRRFSEYSGRDYEV